MSLKTKHTLRNARPAEQSATMIRQKASISSIGWITLLMIASMASGLNIPARKLARLKSPGSSVMSDIANTNGKIPRSPPMTKLLYAHGDYSYSEDDQRDKQHDDAVSGLRTRMSSWWTNVFPSSQVDDADPQAAVDDYLEFLDRRYHRLHDDEHAPSTSPVKPFSAWDWLMDKDGSNDAPTYSTENHEDALFVLGVAELASERLLQKHLKPSAPAQVIDTKATTITTSKTNGLFGSTSSPSSSVLERVRERRRALIAYQEKQMKRAALVSVRAAAMVPLGIVKVAEGLWHYGGGKKTLALTLGVLTGLFLLIRPAMAALVGVVVE